MEAKSSTIRPATWYRADSCTFYPHFDESLLQLKGRVHHCVLSTDSSYFYKFESHFLTLIRLIKEGMCIPAATAKTEPSRAVPSSPHFSVPVLPFSEEGRHILAILAAASVKTISLGLRVCFSAPLKKFTITYHSLPIVRPIRAAKKRQAREASNQLPTRNFFYHPLAQIVRCCHPYETILCS